MPRLKYLCEQGRTRPGQIVTWTINSNHKSRLARDVVVGLPQGERAPKDSEPQKVPQID